MRALVLCVSIALAGSSMVLAQDPNSVAFQKLNELRQKKRDLANRHRAAVIVVNESNVPGQEHALFNEAAVLFSSKGYEIVSEPDANAAGAAHAKGTPWSQEELAAIADRFQVETVAVARLTKYQAKKKIGIPVLPMSDIRTSAFIEMNAAVYRRSEGRIVWTDAVNHREHSLVGASMVSRDEARHHASLNAMDQLFNGYLNKKN